VYIGSNEAKKGRGGEKAYNGAAQAIQGTEDNRNAAPDARRSEK
jgi:hypothetical protein